jgi:hypothetical protein
LFVTSSAAVRRSAIAQVGDFEPLPGNEDVELWARLALHGPVAVSGKLTVNYRVDTGGITDLGAKEGHKPLKREELSSTIPLLTSRLGEIRDPATRREIADYMNSRIGIRVVRAVIEGDIDYANQLIRVCDGRLLGKARLAAMIARLPKWLGKAIVQSNGAIKGGLRALRRA